MLVSFATKEYTIACCDKAVQMDYNRKNVTNATYTLRVIYNLIINDPPIEEGAAQAER